MLAFWASWTPCYICWVRHVLTLALLFKSLENSRMGTRLLEFGEIRLAINQSVPCGIGVFTRRSELSFRCLLSKVISFILSMLYIKHCLLLLPLFVTICEIWLSRLTYSVYLVLSIKPDATHMCIYNRHRVEKSRRGPFKTVSCVENQRMKVGAINQRQGKKVECNLRII